MKIPKLKIKKIKDLFKKVPRVLAAHSLLTLFGLIIIALIFSGLIFYRYVILIQKAELEITEKPLQFKEKTFENIIKIWQEREDKFDAVKTKNYLNPFLSATSTKELTK